MTNAISTTIISHALEAGWRINPNIRIDKVTVLSNGQNGTLCGVTNDGIRFTASGPRAADDLKLLAPIFLAGKEV